MAPTALPRRSVLVVDDSAVCRQLVRDFIADPLGPYDVSEVEDAGAAVQRCAAVTPDIIVLDYDMPGQTGLEVLPALRAACPLARIVMWTASDPHGLRRRALDDGADGFVSKDAGIVALADWLDAA